MDRQAERAQALSQKLRVALGSRHAPKDSSERRSARVVPACRTP
jgi:hypothetical protein